MIAQMILWVVLTACSDASEATWLTEQVFHEPTEALAEIAKAEPGCTYTLYKAVPVEPTVTNETGATIIHEGEQAQ